MAQTKLVAPFPWFGGKTAVAADIWARFGKVDRYTEPFCGSCAVLLANPYHGVVETVNDADHFIVNFWRSIAQAPNEVYEAYDNGVAEADLHARHIWLVTKGVRRLRKVLIDPGYCVPQIAGWWLWGVGLNIGSGWCSGFGSWNEKALLGLEPPKTERTGRIMKKVIDLYHARREKKVEQFVALATRFESVRVACGDWKRVVTPSATGTIDEDKMCAVYLDPPYGEKAKRDKRLYREDCLNVAQEVMEWCKQNTRNRFLRIALSGYAEEHIPLEEHGWKRVTWKANGGFANQSKRGSANRMREAIWFSPNCLEPQPELFQ